MIKTGVGPVTWLQSLWIHRSFANVDLKNHVFLDSSILSDSYVLPQHSLSSKGGDYYIVISHLGLSVPRSLTLWVMSDCVSLCLFPSAARGSSSDDGSTRHWSINGTENHLKLFHHCMFSFVSDQYYLALSLGPWVISSQVLAQ